MSECIGHWQNVNTTIVVHTIFHWKTSTQSRFYRTLLLYGGRYTKPASPPPDVAMASGWML